MKRFGMLCAACAATLLFSGCGAEKTDPMKEEMLLTAPDDFDADYSNCLKTYFQAVENKDFETYKTVVYPPYLTVYEEYLKGTDSSLEAAFETLCTRFDEDGYASWHLTELSVSESTGGEADSDAFFEAYVNGGVFDEQFVEQCKKETKEIKDIVFSVGALYEGDETPVAVVSDSEILMMKTDAGTYLFG